MTGSKMSFMGLLIVAAALFVCANAATTYTVGDSLGWTIPPNNSSGFYEQWASNKTFQIGDSVVFKWNGTHTATEVASKEDYDNCTKTGTTLTDSGVVITFKVNGTFYYVCNVDAHCEQGQKVTIKVGNGITQVPEDSAASSLSSAAFVAFFSAIIMFLCNFM